MAKTLQTLYNEALTKHQAATEQKDITLMQECLNDYNAILNQTPYEDALLFQITTLLHQIGYNGLAIRIFETMRAKHGEHPEIWNNLGTCWKQENNNEKAEENFQKALEVVDPNNHNLRSMYFNNLATLHVNENTPEIGIKYSLQALQEDPNNYFAHWNYALMLLETQDWEQGLKEYDCGVMSNNRPHKFYSDDPKAIPYYFGADGQDLENRTIVIYGEQGLGDEIMFVQGLRPFMEMHPNTTIIYDCHDRLESCMKRNFPELEIHPTRKNIGTGVPDWLGDRVIHYRMGIASLWRHTFPTGEFIRKPYLTPDPKLVKYYRQRLEKTGPGPYVGFGWAGGAKLTHGHERSFKLTPLMPIMTQTGTFISLQYTGEANEKLKRHEQNTGVKIHHWPDAVSSWLDEPTCKEQSPGFNYDHTLALMAALDLSVLPNTTAVHAGGAVGANVWSLTPDKCAWRYRGEEDHMVMYGPHVRLYREHGDWDKAIQGVICDYPHFLRGRKNMKMVLGKANEAEEKRRGKSA